MDGSTRESAGSSTPAPGGGGGATLRRNRTACDACHSAKVRCVPDDPSCPSGDCRRCARSDMSCSYSELLPRRKPTRTKNQRLSELERRVHDLQVLLQAHTVEAGADTNTAMSAGANAELLAAWLEGAGRPFRNASAATTVSATPAEDDDAAAAAGSSSSAPPETPVPKAPEAEEEPDVVDRGILSEEQAARIIMTFRTYMEGQLLGIRLPKNRINRMRSSFRKSRPILWLSILCAASGSSDEGLELAEALRAEMASTLRDRLTPAAEPSLELVRAVRYAFFYHHEPTYILQHEFLGQARLAIRMIVLLAQGSKIPEAAAARSRFGFGGADEETIETCRELLAWFWVSYTLTMKIREPNMLAYNELVRQSMKILARSGDDPDRCLLAWIRLARIAHVATSALFRGYTELPDGLDDAARDRIVKRFRDQMDQWSLNCPIDVMNEQLMVEQHQYYLFISELLYPAGKRELRDFQARDPALPPLHRVIPLDSSLLAPWRVDYTKRCIQSAHGMLDLFLAIDPLALRRLPVSTFTRAFYALRFLFQLAHQIWATGSEEVIRVNSLKINSYIAALDRSLTLTSGEGRYRVPSMWLYALRSRLQPWHAAFRALVDAGATPALSPSGAVEYIEVHHPDRRRVNWSGTATSTALAMRNEECLDNAENEHAQRRRNGKGVDRGPKGKETMQPEDYERAAVSFNQMQSDTWQQPASSSTEDELVQQGLDHMDLSYLGEGGFATLYELLSHADSGAWLTQADVWGDRVEGNAAGSES